MQDGEQEGKEEFAIVFAAMGVNMETAHYFKQASVMQWMHYADICTLHLYCL